VFDEVDFHRHATAQSPPVFLWYATPNVPMTPDLPDGMGIHHPVFGLTLRKRLAELGVPCELRLREDRPELDEPAARAWYYEEMVAFLRRWLFPEGRA
jgi:hypothetical protein